MSNVMTTREEILEYWWDTLREVRFGITKKEGLRCCWRCGCNHSFSKLHRCHIIPAGADGEDTPSNLVLLCSVCHGEAPSFVDKPWVMWDWIRRTSRYSDNVFLGDAIIREYKRIFGVDPNPDNFSLGKFYEALDSMYIHFSSNTRAISFASYAYALRIAGA